MTSQGNGYGTQSIDSIFSLVSGLSIMSLYIFRQFVNELMDIHFGGIL